MIKWFISHGVDCWRQSFFLSKWNLRTTRSHRTKSHILGRKLHCGTSKSKQLVPVYLDLSLFRKSHCTTCITACVILYHVTGSCKGPIQQWISLFQALGSWGRAKTSQKTNEGGLRRGAALPSFLALVLPYFFSRSPFFRSQLPRVWNRLAVNIRRDAFRRLKQMGRLAFFPTRPRPHRLFPQRKIRLPPA